MNMSDEFSESAGDDPITRTSLDISRRVRNFLRQQRPELKTLTGLEDADIETALATGALRAAVYYYIHANDYELSDDDKRQLVADVSAFIDKFLEAKGG